MLDKNFWNNPTLSDDWLSALRGSVRADRKQFWALDARTQNLLQYIRALENCIANTYSIKNEFGFTKRARLENWLREWNKSTIDGDARDDFNHPTQI